MLERTSLTKRPRIPGERRTSRSASVATGPPPAGGGLGSVRRAGARVRQPGRKATGGAPTATTAAWRSRRRRKGSASGLHVGIAHPEHVVRTHLEPLHLPGDAEELVELPEEEPHRLVVQPGERLGPQLLPPLGIAGALRVLECLG